MLNQRKVPIKMNPDLELLAKKESLSSSSNSNIAARNHQELEATIENLHKLLEISRLREKRLVSKLEQLGGGQTISLDLETQSTSLLLSSSNGEYDNCPLEPKVSFLSSVIDRGGWLIGLLTVQSLSSFVLSWNESLFREHPNIIYFLTMLVGAGGNAGNQAAVRVIRGIALGSINDKNFTTFLYRECLMAITLSVSLGAVGIIRTMVTPHISALETFAIGLSLMLIVFISIVAGCLLPFILQALKFDPAHSSTSIQVIMDIAGVLITCLTAHLILNTGLGPRLFHMPSSSGGGLINGNHNPKSMTS